MKKLIILAFAIGFAGLIASQAFAGATQVDALIEKLVDKGILTRAEGIKLKGEIAADEKLVREESKKELLPDFVRNMKLKGDLRTRMQYEKKSNDTEARTRARIRYRLGIESTVNDQVKVMAGIASGGSDPRSTNQTLQNSFEQPDIRLNYAAGEYTPAKWAKIVLGKFEKKPYLWAPTDLLWDTDINPGGAMISLENAIFGNPRLSFFTNTGVLVIDENGKLDRADPYVKVLQGGLKWKGSLIDVAAAGTHYAFNGLKGTCPDWSSKTNTGVTGATINSDTGACTAGTGVLTHDYDSVVASGELGFTNLFGGLPLGIDDRIFFFADFVHNPDPSDNNNGWAYGLGFGKAKLAIPGDWQIKVLKTTLERDAWPDFLPDSDRLAGATNINGQEYTLEYVWKKNVILGLDFYQTDTLIGAHNRERLLQADVVFKF